MSEWWTPTSTLNHQQHWASHWTHLRWTLGAARDPTFEFFNSKKVEIGHYLHWLSHAAEKLNCREIEDASTHSLERVYCPLSLSYTRALTSNICFHFSSSFRAHSNCLSLTSTRTFRPQTSFIHRPSVLHSSPLWLAPSSTAVPPNCPDLWERLGIKNKI